MNNLTSNKKCSLNKKQRLVKFLCIIAIICVVLLSFCYYENHHLVISEYTYSTEKIGPELDGFKIVQISDLHNAVFGKNNERLLKKIKGLDPDIIVLTGDIVDEKNSDFNSALDFAKNAAEICPVYYVTGNHEYAMSTEKREEFFTGLEENGVTVLFNEIVTISPNNTSGNASDNFSDSAADDSAEFAADEAFFNLIGLDNNYLAGGTLAGLLAEHRDELNIVLAHRPHLINNYSDAGADLVLSGHAHGGQFRLPFIGGVYAPGQGFNPEYTAGTYTVNNTTMIVSRGLGNPIILPRLFNDPEIVCVTLKNE